MSHDRFSPAERSAVMRRVKSKDTAPELALRRLLTHMGLRYRLHRRELPGSPDIVFASRKVALFMHGCFWHGHVCRRGARMPQNNLTYWSQKIARNQTRDAEVETALTGIGWCALVVWECELKNMETLEARLSAALR